MPNAPTLSSHGCPSRSYLIKMRAYQRSSHEVIAYLQKFGFDAGIQHQGSVNC